VRILKILLFILPITLIATLIYLLPRVITINSIDCTSQYGPCNRLIAGKVDMVSDGPWGDVRNDLDEILSENVFVNNYSVQYGFPDKFKVFLVEEKPIYGLFDLSQNTILISRQGYVLASSDETNLPTALVTAPLPLVGEKVQDNLHFGLIIISEITPIYKIDKSEFRDSGLHVYLEDGLELVFPLEGEADVLLGALTLIISRLRDNKGEPKIDKDSEVAVIDLRFRNPVLRLTN